MKLAGRQKPAERDTYLECLKSFAFQWGLAFTVALKLILTSLFYSFCLSECPQCIASGFRFLIPTMHLEKSKYTENVYYIIFVMHGGVYNQNQNSLSQCIVGIVINRMC